MKKIFLILLFFASNIFSMHFDDMLLYHSGTRVYNENEYEENNEEIEIFNKIMFRCTFLSTLGIACFLQYHFPIFDKQEIKNLIKKFKGLKFIDLKIKGYLKDFLKKISEDEENDDVYDYEEDESLANFNEFFNGLEEQDLNGFTLVPD